MRKCDVIVIGGGPAGITFSRELKKLKPKTDIIMLRPEKHSMVYCAIPYAIEGLFDPTKVYKKDNLITDVGVQLIQRSAQKIDLKTKRVIDDIGETYEAAKIFIATGASPILPQIPGTRAKNIYTVKTQADMEALIANFDQHPKQAIVIGAGAIGIEQAQAYRTRGLEVHLIDMADRVLVNMLDEDMAALVNDSIQEQGIHLQLNTQIKSIKTKYDRATQASFSNGKSIELDPDRDFIVFAIGMKPDIGIFEGQGLEITSEGIVIDNQMRTNIPGIYAAGDCCAYFSGIDGESISGRLATNAVPMAKVAARVIAGKDDTYEGFYNGAATCAYDLRIGSTGFTATMAAQHGINTIAGHGETTTLFPMMPGAGKLKVKIVADATNLQVIGGQVISTLPVTDKIDILTLALQRRLTLKDLSQLSYSAQPWQSFFPARNAIVEACEHALDNSA
ncbi:MAG: FAD-dependent oxidoreductase [Sedimentisphaerales bacterium]|nr:FAD-dependent oxidoreductase [Sedimentisphaerales bacterium]